jgi:hypothetical protein
MKQRVSPENDWREIGGYRLPHRINQEGCVQKQKESGEWVTLNQYLSGRKRACVKIKTTDGRRVDVPVKQLMADAFMGGCRPGMCIVSKNGSKLDCSLRNLKFVSKQECGTLSCRNRRMAVAKISRCGEVVAIYTSGREAAQKNYISQSSIWLRCTGQVADPFSLDGYDYQYIDGNEKPWAKKKKAIAQTDAT